MHSKTLSVGISLFAFATASAQAQAQSTPNSSQFSQTGTNNSGTIDNAVAGNSGNSGTVIQNGLNNSGSVYQRGSFNQGFVQQVGSANQLGERQVGTSNAADYRQNGDLNGAFSTQIGDSNTTTVLQLGSNDVSTVRQGYAVDASVPNGEFRAANGNQASVDQGGSGLSSVINQRGSSASAPAASDNTANVYQRSSSSSSSLQQASQITQESRGNYAELFQYDGGAGAPNSSTIIQRFTGAQASNPTSSNSATVAQQGASNLSQVSQDGLRNFAKIRAQGGGAAASDGNSQTIGQTGSDLWAQVTAGRTAAFVKSNVVDVHQTGANHSASAFQFGNGDRTAITQGDGPNTGSPSLGVLARAVAGVYQSAGGDAATVIQVGDNVADLTQAYGSGSTAVIQQKDAGDAGSARAYNSGIVTQYGTNNAASIDQDGIGAQATTWQKVGSSNNAIDISQGRGRTALPSTTSTPGFSGGPPGTGTIGAVANSVQTGSYNDAMIYQDGSTLRADADQGGSGASGTHNIVFISQTGASNIARAVQGTGVGPSAAGDPASGYSASQNNGSQDEFYFAGGSRSAEIRILQTNTGNSASVEQYGRGQVARVEQSGADNVASIIQQAAATNATAVIRQLGSGNSYTISQTQAGQYVVVSQSGTNNSANSVVSHP